MMDATLIHEEFPLTREWTYLASASNGILPERSRRYLARYFAEAHYLELAPHYRMFDDLASLREKAARLFGGSGQNWALMPNTSFGLNTAAAAVPWTAGDNVVLGDIEFPANVYPWKNCARRGVEIRWVEADCMKTRAEDLAAACDARTRIVSVAAVQFLNGYVPDLASLAAFCAERGIWLCVDGIQGLGNRDWDLTRLGVDFLAAGGQKWLCSPRGSGLFYLSDRALAALREKRLLPAYLGWLNWERWKFSELLDYERPLCRDARLLEVGTYAFHDLICLGHALDLVAQLGLGAIAAHSDRMRELLISGLAEGGLIERFAPSCLDDAPERRSQILSLACEEPLEAWRRLAERKIAVNPREGGIRVSFHYYNTERDVERLLEGLAAL